MTEARELYVLVQLLDHQLIDEGGELAGKIDDVELAIAPDGGASVDALLSGPGVLATRTGHARYGLWRERLESAINPDGNAMTRIPMSLVRSIGVSVVLSVPRKRLASTGSEQWVREHIIGHIPGAGDGGSH